MAGGSGVVLPMKINGAAGPDPQLKRRCHRALWVLDARNSAAIRRLRTPMHFAMSAALFLACSAMASAAIPQIQQRVGAVGCPANDQMGPARLQAGESMPAPVEQRMAEQIAYFKAEGSPGVYAPKGWSCRAWYGSNGSVLVVTPKRIEPPYFPLPMITGPAVMIETWDGGTSGRFHVAIVAAQLFPLLGSEFITRVRQEHLIADSSFDAEPYPDDQLRYLSDRLVEYTTPPNRTGLGTDGLFEMSNLPVRGLTILNLEAEVNSLTEVRVKMPAGLNSVAQAIVQLETACLQLQQGCRGLQ
jgi:hypothetical protein